MSDFILGRGADSLVLGFDVAGFGSGTRVFGNNGDDNILIRAEQVDGPFSVGFAAGLLVDGGRGDDQITILDAMDEQVLGGPGSDVVELAGSGSTVAGGSGDDEISARFSSRQSVRPIPFGGENTLRGENGNDTIESSGSNMLDGGKGDDTLLSYNLIFEYMPGSILSTGANTLTGGSGDDMFVSSTHSRLTVSEGYDDGEISEGDFVRGAMDIITDYEANDVLNIGTTVNSGGPPELRQNGLRPYGDLVVPRGEYAALRGDYDASARGFTVNGEGSDLLVVHDTFSVPAGYGLVTGCVVLLGVTSIGELQLIG